MPDLFLTRRAREDLQALPRVVQNAIVESLTVIEADPRAAGKPLRGRLRGLWSCRVGNYRILYTLEGTKQKQRVIVRAVRHRATSYPTRRKR